MGYFDKDIAKLEDQVTQAKGFLRFFAAHIHAQGGAIEINDYWVGDVTDKDQFSITHDDKRKTTVIGVSSS